ncbi:MAG TPA: aromatic amino acid lyase, partial [Candidatus Poseidoniales archaeon]
MLDGRSLTTEALLAIAERRANVECAPDALERVRLARATVEGIIGRDEVVYGINTGFGALVNTRIDSTDLERLQLNLIRSHATAVGTPMTDVEVRAMMAVRLNSLLAGHSGVHEDPLQQLVELLNHGITPVVPRLGSLGASGDLAPLSHVALALIGEG